MPSRVTRERWANQKKVVLQEAKAEVEAPAPEPMLDTDLPAEQPVDETPDTDA